MSVVLKYQLGPITTLDLPPHSRVRAVGRDANGTPSIWIEAEHAEPGATRWRFMVIGTGWDVPAAAAYVGTIFPTDLYPEVWHVYEVAT